jgi:SAM-dependent methyltransferase
MPAAKLGWNRLFGEISGRARGETVAVYDAGCGFGGIAEELAAAGPPALYVGADVHTSLAPIAERIDGFARWGILLRWDVTRPLPVDGRFDYVLCRAAIHHTPDPPATFRALAGALAPGGTLAISAYARKGAAREAVDDALRARIGALPPEEAFAACEAFTALGRALAEISERVRVPVDVPLLGLRAGEYGVQQLVYDHLLKCFWNESWGERFSTLVNYDWYHPEHAHRYEVDELRAWFEDAGLHVRSETSTAAQHYLEGTAPG